MGLIALPAVSSEILATLVKKGNLIRTRDARLVLYLLSLKIGSETVTPVRLTAQSVIILRPVSSVYSLFTSWME